MNTSIKTKGFTIVELLIVIIVIAILATISFVSYTGVQNRSKAEKAKANAASVKKVAEDYYSRNNTYPTAVSHFRSNPIQLSSDIQLFTSGSFDAAVGETTVAYKYVGTAANATGACIYHWSFTGITSASTWPSKPANGEAGVTEPKLLGNATLSTCSASTTAGTTPSP